VSTFLFFEVSERIVVICTLEIASSGRELANFGSWFITVSTCQQKIRR
jgi:hypothetical protein